jgi:heavy metal sensor kinase
MKSLDGLIRRSLLIFIAGCILVLALSSYMIGETFVRRFVDGRLLGVARTVATMIEQQPTLLAEDLVSAARIAGEDEVVHSLQLFSLDGHLIWKGSDSVPRQPVTDMVFPEVRRGNTVFRTLQSADGKSARYLYMPIFQQGEPRYMLQAEAPLLLYHKTLEGLVILLAAGFTIILLVVWMASGWLAKKVLVPIQVLSQEAEAMSGADLVTRLPLPSRYEEFRRLTAAFNAVVDRFARSAEGQRRFVDHAAHEMKTPLTVLRGDLEVALLRARTAAEYREALLNNVEQVERLIALTRSLLTLAQFTSDRPPVHLVPLDLEPLVQNLVHELTVLADDRGIKLSCDAQSVPPILGDAQWLKQALINLLDNALRYTSPGGAVTIRLHKAGREIAVSVEDTGHGIEPEHLPHLFARFYRSDWARAKDSGGTGLGLPIVKEIADAHGGAVTVTSQVGKGSIFTLYVPIPAASSMAA